MTKLRDKISKTQSESLSVNPRTVNFSSHTPPAATLFSWLNYTHRNFPKNVNKQGKKCPPNVSWLCRAENMAKCHMLSRVKSLLKKDQNLDLCTTSTLCAYSVNNAVC